MTVLNMSLADLTDRVVGLIQAQLAAKDAEIASLKADIERLSAPVGDDEASAAVIACESGSYQDAMNEMLASRLNPKETK